MGIRGLTSLINKHCPESVCEYNLAYYTKAIIAIDTSILLYKFRYSSYNNPQCHITGFLNKCLRFVSYGIYPVFILDGIPPDEKKDIIEKRNKQRQKILDKIKKLECSSENVQKEIEKLNKQIIQITKEHRDECKQLLKLLGFEVITSEGEAETLCVYLQKKGLVHYTFTDDTDALALGCKKVLRTHKNNKYKQINLDKVLEKLELNYEEFVDMCILCGCDYCPSIPRIGYANAYELIKKYKNIETVIENIKDKYDIPLTFNYQNARDIFLKNDFSVKLNKKQEINFDEDKLKDFLLDKNFKNKNINSFIRKYKEKISYFNSLISFE